FAQGHELHFLGDLAAAGVVELGNGRTATARAAVRHVPRSHVPRGDPFCAEAGAPVTHIAALGAARIVEADRRLAAGQPDGPPPASVTVGVAIRTPRGASS